MEIVEMRDDELKGILSYYFKSRNTYFNEEEHLSTIERVFPRSFCEKMLHEMTNNEMISRTERLKNTGILLTHSKLNSPLIAQMVSFSETQNKCTSRLTVVSDQIIGNLENDSYTWTCYPFFEL